MPGSDAWRTVGGFDEIIAFVALVLTAQRVDEDEGLGQLPGADEKTRAIHLPTGRDFPHTILPLGEGGWVCGSAKYAGYLSMLIDFRSDAVHSRRCPGGWNIAEGDENLRANHSQVNSKSVVQCEKVLRNFPEFAKIKKTVKSCM